MEMEDAKAHAAAVAEVNDAALGDALETHDAMEDAKEYAEAALDARNEARAYAASAAKAMNEAIEYAAAAAEWAAKTPPACVCQSFHPGNAHGQVAGA